jgi:hypothetical protein
VIDAMHWTVGTFEFRTVTGKYSFAAAISVTTEVLPTVIPCRRHHDKEIHNDFLKIVTDL